MHVASTPGCILNTLALVTSPVIQAVTTSGSVKLLVMQVITNTGLLMLLVMVMRSATTSGLLIPLAIRVVSALAGSSTWLGGTPYTTHSDTAQHSGNTIIADTTGYQVAMQPDLAMTLVIHMVTNPRLVDTIGHAPINA